MKDTLEKKDFEDMSKPPTAHHAGEGSEALRAKTTGPKHMRDEKNPTAGGQDQLNQGQERRVGERRRDWVSHANELTR
jgi:hypothetical protein